MQSNLKKILVYDLETGGLDFKKNSITEFAGVVVENEGLTIVDKISVMFKPRIDLSWIEGLTPIKVAKELYKILATADENKIKGLPYKGERLSIRSLDSLAEEIDKFTEEVLEFSKIINTEEYLKLRDSEHKGLVELFFDSAYNPQALSVTHITKEMLMTGVDYEEGFKIIEEFFKKHKTGNSKPILAGHNIKAFDNPFLEKCFNDNGSSLGTYINSLIMDSLEMARLRWFEHAGGFSLGVVANSLGLTLKSAHRALPDTIANAKFIIKLIQSLRGEGAQKQKYTRKKFSANF